MTALRTLPWNPSNRQISRELISWAPWVAFALLLLPLLTAMASALLSGLPDLSMTGDSALLEMATRNTASGAVLLGPCSRFGFHHPGLFTF